MFDDFRFQFGILEPAPIDQRLCRDTQSMGEWCLPTIAIERNPDLRQEICHCGLHCRNRTAKYTWGFGNWITSTRTFSGTGHNRMRPVTYQQTQSLRWAASH